MHSVDASHTCDAHPTDDAHMRLSARRCLSDEPREVIPDEARARIPQDVLEGISCLWLNPGLDLTARPGVDDDPGVKDITAAESRFTRFASYLALRFPELISSDGRIESPLVRSDALGAHLGLGRGRLLCKLDGELPVVGSVKARGGIHEVLVFAEEVALAEGLLSKLDDDHTRLATDECREVFSHYTVQAGSTGNLGISIGIMAASFGFKTIIHMSSDARQWKKDLLRAKGVDVVEYEGDYALAVAQGRAGSAADSRSHFVDDERSLDLFSGYATAGKRLESQLASLDIAVDEQHPLFVYIPCGVGGAPGGIAFGLKERFGMMVHVFFAEPTQCCCMLAGLATGLYEGIDVRDLGLSGKTVADGLAVSRPSALVCGLISPYLSGIFTVEDSKLHDLELDLWNLAGVFAEPSACAAIPGPRWLCSSDAGKAYLTEHGIEADSITHVVWTTGGGLVPADERRRCIGS